MIAYHTLRADMRTGSGSSREKPWKIDEERTLRGGTIELCKRGYHSSPTAFATLAYIQGPVLCLVEVSEPEQRDATKQVSRSRKLLRAVNVETELRLFACDCAERALLREREHGREPDERSWKAIEVSRLFARGEATVEELAAAAAAAGNWQRRRFDELVTSKLTVST